MPSVLECDMVMNASEGTINLKSFCLGLYLEFKPCSQGKAADTLTPRARFTSSVETEI
jgi:hypothetical protein